MLQQLMEGVLAQSAQTGQEVLAPKEHVWPSGSAVQCALLQWAIQFQLSSLLEHLVRAFEFKHACMHLLVACTFRIAFVSEYTVQFLARPRHGVASIMFIASVGGCWCAAVLTVCLMPQRGYNLPTKLAHVLPRTQLLSEQVAIRFSERGHVTTK
jgi:hypothetical protein